MKQGGEDDDEKDEKVEKMKKDKNVIKIKLKQFLLPNKSQCITP